MKKTFKSAVSMLLALCICLSNVPGIFAMATEENQNGNKEIETIWNGAGLTADVKAGKDGYTFMSVYHSPASAYEMSNHMVSINGGVNNDIPQTLMLVPADKDYTWTPDGKYSFGVSNYEVLYCCDAETGYEDGVYYKRLNLEDSDYYTPEEAAHIRAIITNSYPYVSLEQMKANLVAAGVEGAADLDRAEIIAGVQAAVWFYANGDAFDYKYSQSFNVSTNPQWGSVAHDYTAEMSEVIQALGKRKFNVDDEVGKRILALAEYLKNLDKVYADQNQIIITKLEIIGANPMNDKTTIRVALNNGGSSENDNIKLNIYVDGELVETRAINREFTSYDMNINAKVGQTIKAVVSGTQVMPENVYFYEPEGGREVSQCLVGVASGETDVYAEAEMTITSTPDIPVDKTATPLNKYFQTDVTLSVPGDVDGDVDVVILLGGGMQANRETVDSAINLFKPLMKNGKTKVKLGLISLEKGEEIIVDLNSEEAVLDPETFEEFITEKFAYINSLPGGSTNLHSQLLEAQKMLDADTSVRTENKYLFVLATGRTYWFDDANGEQATIVNKVNGTYYWADYLWRSQRGCHTSLYMIPDRYNDSYEAFFADIEKWVAADGDTYVFTPHFDAKDNAAYANWYAKNNKDLRALGIAGSRYGLGIVDPVPTAENFITGVPAAIGSENHPLHALNYERAQYECVQVWKELVATGYNCYSICSESPSYQNGSEYIKLGAGYTGTSTTQLGHSFMNYLATLAGQEFAPTVWDFERDAEGNFLSANVVLQENFFDPIAADIIYTCGIGSYVEDFIGYDPQIGNFEFITDADTIVLTVGGVKYITTQVTTKEGATASYAFAKEGEEPTFWMDYYYGNGKTTERFIWTFGENVTMENQTKLTYKLQLTDMATEAGDYWIDTNLSATLYPVIATVTVDSEINTFALRETVVYEYGDPVIFPVPEVEYLVEKINVEVTKKWDDANNQDGKRPESIEVELYVNDQKVLTDMLTIADKVDDNTWTSTFDNVVIYKLPGEEVTIEVKEVIDADSDYVASVDGLTITNKYTPEETDITVNKIWNDANNQDGKRPGSITVTLLANGEQIAIQEITAEMGWTYTFENLPVYANGRKIVYTITEAEVEGYTTVINGFEITNTYKPEETQITVNKVWNDANNQDGKRPGSITVTLLANGEKVTTQKITAEMGWTYTFENLPVYANGQKIVYTVTEAAVEGYTTVIDGFKITNTYNPEETQVVVNKVWDDDDDFEGKRPDEITIRLYADGVEILAQKVTVNDNWTFTFKNLPVYANGQKIVYTISEDAVSEYTTLGIEGNAETGFTVTNQYLIEVPEEDPPLIDKTGDNIGMAMMAAMVSLMGAAVCVWNRKKETENA